MLFFVFIKKICIMINVKSYLYVGNSHILTFYNFNFFDKEIN